MSPESLRRHPREAVSEPAPARAAGAALAGPAEWWLGNGRLRSLVTATGSGGAWLGEQALTSWRGDAIEDADGWFLYLRDLDDGSFWSAGLRPVAGAPERYAAGGDAGSVTIERDERGIAARLDVWVDAEADAECRRLVLHNRGRGPRRIELTSFLEVVLNDPGHHAGHPAFSRLFVRTSRHRTEPILLAQRRPRAAEQKHPWMGLAVRGGEDAGFDTDRARFLGRGRGADRPIALTGRAPLSGTVGDVLDPALVMRRVVEIAPGARERIDLLLAAGWDRDGVVRTAERFPDAAAFDASLACVRVAAPAPLVTLVAGGNGARQDPSPPAAAATWPFPAETLRCDNGTGGFTAAGDEYVIRMPAGEDGSPRLTPRPWINVLANPGFGSIVSESGAACTWSRNSRLFRLTPWHNDPVSDPHDEALYLRDRESGRVWSPFAGPIPGPGGYEMRHGFGSSRCRHASDDLELETTVFVDADDPVKVTRLRVTNRGPRRRALAIVSYQRLVLGELPGGAVTTSARDGDRVLTARRDEGGGLPGAVAFAAPVFPDRARVRLGGDRAAFLGPGGSPRRPARLLAGGDIDERTGADLDPCFCVQVDFDVEPGETRVCAFLLGESDDPGAIAALVRRLRAEGALDRAQERVRERWHDLLGRVRVETPIESLDVMLNGWLAYQTLACRLWGRTALYQSGGAFGFRDQLQDAASFLVTEPRITREQILLHAAHQFVEGDVLHWWHPPAGRGIRTRFADDLLWLPFVTAAYLRSTGDSALLDEPVRSLAARALEPGEDEASLDPEDSGETTALYEHCCRAIDRSLVTGVHGLPLFGTGDWNDGMNRVGREGRGESVWMGFFLITVIDAFAPLCAERGDDARAARYRRAAARLSAAIEQAGWDGGWYRRGYFDDGTPLGTSTAEECRIDALVQAWAVLSGAAPRERADQAMDAVERELVLAEEGLVRLLAPPFDRMKQDPGYIKGYLPGVRENGGQYTHAALWVAEAMARLGRRATAARILEWISPAFRAGTPEGVARYQAEPYVVAADICTGEGRAGQAGWTWYTGSSGWMARIVLEALLGVSLENGTELVIRAAIPGDWPGYRLSLRPWGGAERYEIEVRNLSGEAASVSRVRMDGEEIEPVAGRARIPVLGDGRDHRIDVELR